MRNLHDLLAYLRETGKKCHAFFEAFLESPFFPIRLVKGLVILGVFIFITLLTLKLYLLILVDNSEGFSLSREFFYFDPTFGSLLNKYSFNTFFYDLWPDFNDIKGFDAHNAYLEREFRYSDYDPIGRSQSFEKYFHTAIWNVIRLYKSVIFAIDHCFNFNYLFNVCLESDL
jgi:hypothetical protein